jgi:hypothetical protein
MNDSGTAIPEAEETTGRPRKNWTDSSGHTSYNMEPKPKYDDGWMVLNFTTYLPIKMTH